MQTRAIAAQWRSQCVSDAVWIEAENQAGALDAVADGFYMSSECIDWRRAYVKPRALGGLKGRAAREKLAFDLAFEIDVPVAPVVLIDRHDAVTTQERHPLYGRRLNELSRVMLRVGSRSTHGSDREIITQSTRTT